jgi:hypothetical protein
MEEQTESCCLRGSQLVEGARGYSQRWTLCLVDVLIEQYPSESGVGSRNVKPLIL